MDKEKKEALSSRLKICLVLAIVLVIVSFLPATAKAASVIKTTKAQTTPAGSLVKTSNGYRYKLKNGTYAKDTWLYINKKIFSFDENGYARTGWFTYNGAKYYASSKGYVYYSLWHKEGNNKYYLRYNGEMAKSKFLTIGGKVYRFASDGRLLKSCIYKVWGNYYYSDKEGVRRSNIWLSVGNDRYYFGKDGKRVQSKWVKYNGKYYYMQADGKMARNTRIDSKWYVGDDGARQEVVSTSVLYVGDSRTVGMKSVCSDSDVEFVAKVGEGYYWLKNTADSQVQAKLKANPEMTVVFAFGINDIGNLENYISYYKALMKKYPKAKFFFLSLNPCEPTLMRRYYTASAPLLTDDKLQIFNNRLKAAFGASSFVDTFSWLKKNGFKTADGLHYDTATNTKLFAYINTYVKSK